MVGAATPTYHTWDGHGQPERGIYYGTARTLIATGIGVPVTFRGTDSGVIRVASATAAWEDSVGRTEKFWFLLPRTQVVAVSPNDTAPHSGRPQDGYEMLLARYTWTATGDPLTYEQARAEFGAHVRAWIRPGWFWAAATPRSAEAIRAVGHRAVGTAVTTWIPPQSAPVVSDVPEPEGNHRAVQYPPASA